MGNYNRKLIVLLIFFKFTNGILSVRCCTPEVAVYVCIETGDDENNDGLGTDTPVATINRAISIIDKIPNWICGEIAILEGEYEETLYLEPSRIPFNSSFSPDRRLIIQNYLGGDKVVFDGSRRIVEAEPLPDYSPNVFIFHGIFPIQIPPIMWIEDEMSNAIIRRFQHVPRVDIVGLISFSYCVFDNETIAFNPGPEGFPYTNPSSWEIKLGAVHSAFQIARSNVTIRGIEFRNYLIDEYSTSIKVGASNSGGLDDNGDPLEPRRYTYNTIIESCKVFNTFRGFNLLYGSENTIVTNCFVRWTGTGIYVQGRRATVEHSTFINDIDDSRFLTGDGTSIGIRYYYHCKYAIIRNNFVKGFPYGLSFKSYKAPLLMEYNTFISGLDNKDIYTTAIYRRSWHEDDIVRYNIFSDFLVPFTTDDLLVVGAIFDFNFYSFYEMPLDHTYTWFIALIQNNMKSGYNISFGRPMYANPSENDYRLLRSSPAIDIIPGIIPGAREVVDVTYYSSPRLTVYAPVIKGNGGAIQFFMVRFPPELPQDDCYFSKNGTLFLFLNVTSTNSIIKTRITILGNDTIQDFQDVLRLELPSGLNEIRLAVQDDANTWSNGYYIYASKLDPMSPKLVSLTKYINLFGVVFIVITDMPCTLEISYKKASDNDTFWSEPIDNHYVWESGYSQSERIVANTSLSLNLEPNTEYNYKIRSFNYWYSNTFEGSFIQEGIPKIYFVSPSGQDNDLGGSRDAPFKTIQYAFTRVLPGERVRLLPGNYFESPYLTHGGTETHPIVIEAVYPGTVIINGLQKTAYGIGLHRAPFVIIRGIRFEWTNSGISATESSHLVVSNCWFQNMMWINGNQWGTGKGIVISKSPFSQVDHCVFAKLWEGCFFSHSPSSTFIHNTVVQCAVYGFRTILSGNNTKVLYNSFNWVGNHALNIAETPELHELLTIDFNNYASSVYCPGECLKIKSPYFYITCGCRELFYDSQYGVIYDLPYWQNITGKDLHSIYVDPLWIDPLADRLDVSENSPNLLGDDLFIGAFGFLGDYETSNVEPEVVILRPYSGELYFEAPSVIFEVSDYDGNVESVYIYIDDDIIFEESVSSPFSLQELCSGGYALRICARDNSNGVGCSDIVHFEIELSDEDDCTILSSGFKHGINWPFFLFISFAILFNLAYKTLRM